MSVTVETILSGETRPMRPLGRDGSPAWTM
jgi:hypothetical protein